MAENQQIIDNQQIADNQQTQQNQPTMRDLPLEKVGVIIVHGIGEQKRFEFLEGETRKIVDAIIAQYAPPQNRRAVTATLTTATSDAFLGAHSSWAAGTEAPLHVLVDMNGQKIVDIAFHEVWWADINEALTIGKQVRFWAWGLSLPGIATRTERYLNESKTRMRLPTDSGKLPLRNRLRMAFVSMLFGFSAFSIALINVVLKRLDFAPIFSSDILVNYLSGVKLYSQDKRAGGSPMDGPDDPPRAAIRRRMVRTMIDVATGGYQRWYILAHSLGTIVAWNGLMETEEALPNYIEQRRWNELKPPLRGTADHDIDVDRMMPNRPVWLKPRDIISRDALFANFRGILTYGSPLERFCALWSAMVPINNNEDPFRTGAEWVNVYDSTDPVGTWVYDYDPQQGEPRNGRTKLKPHNFPCRASSILLYSHLCYLRKPKSGAADGNDYLINQVARWLVTDRSLANEIRPKTQGPNSFWLRSDPDDRLETQKLLRMRVAWRATQDVIVLVLLSVLTVASLKWAIWPVLKAFLGWIGLSGAATTISSFATSVLGAIKAVPAWIGLSPVATAISHRLGRGPTDFLIEIGVLWVVTALAVAFASWIQYRRSTRDHADLLQRYGVTEEKA